MFMVLQEGNSGNACKGSFKNYVYKRGWVGGSLNVNSSNKPYLVKAMTRGRQVVEK